MAATLGPLLILGACSDDGSGPGEAAPADVGCADACAEDATADGSDGETQDAGPCDDGFWGPDCDQLCDCDDGLFCNGAETCDPVEGCQAGAAPELDDGVPCTDDRCDEEADAIVHEPVHARCDDELFCNGPETCDAVEGCLAGLAPVVDDEVPCTEDSCDEDADTIVNEPVHARCDDELFCNGVETCDAVDGCLPGAAPVVDDEVPCTEDSCDEDADTIVNEPVHARCDDDLFCNGVETCNAVDGCLPGPTPVVDDEVPCTEDSCDEDADTIVNEPVHARCDDELFCNGVETCDAVDGCLPGAAPVVDDEVPCTADSCDEDADTVVNEPIHARCDDELFCNGVETCGPNGCAAGAPPQPEDDGDPCTVPSACNEDLDTFDTVNNDLLPTCGFVNSAPVDGVRDYGFWYWPGNHRPTETWPTVEPIMHFLTGHYAFTFDESRGTLGRMGALVDAPDAETAQGLPADDLADLPAASLLFEAGHGDDTVVATTFLGANADTTNRARLTDAGRFMNHVEIPTVRYGDESYEGRLEIASMPRHVVFNHEVTAGTWTVGEESAARVVLSGAVLEGLPDVEWLEEGRALRLTADGQGWVFLVHEDQTTLTYEDGRLIAERRGRVASGTTLTASLLAVPTTAINDAELAMYLDPASVTTTYTLLDRLGRDVRGRPVTWDPTRGAYTVPLQGLRTAGAPRGYGYDVPGFHNWYGRHRLVIDTHGEEVAVPLSMPGGGNISWYITGGAPMLRDNGGDPLGLHVQISKNWHDPPAWYHLYAHPTVSGDGPHELELTMASSRWGADAYAASHAQLSLIGWGTGGGHWDESALGAFGESITYDPDVALGRSMVDDVRPMLVLAERKWLWTGNVGGADFLRYRTESEPYWIRRLSQVRSHYAANAPNLTDVVYAGVTTDGRIQAKIRTQLGRTDDLVRVYYHLEYTFLEDVSYDRLAFFQMAADRYSDNWFTRYAYGNADGVTLDAAVPNHNTTGYAQDADRGIALPGDAPWVMLYASTQDAPPLPENLANVGFVVRDFHADIGGTIVTTPHINLHRTNNRSSQIGFELGLPYEEGSAWCGDPCQGRTRFVPAGSTVRATVEYLVPPSDKSVYYGASDHLLGLPGDVYNSTDMMLMLAGGNDISVTSAIGDVRRQQPVEIDAVQDAIAAEFTLTGGLGHVPVTFHGLNRHDGWWLAMQEGDTWVEVDQTVQGKDFWQTRFVPADQTYSVTFNVPNRGTQTYRLLWSPPTGLPSPPPASIGPQDRPAQLLAPLEYDGRATHPVVIWLHGFGETATASAERFAMTVEAQSQGFFVVLAEGTADPDGRQFWNATPACCDHLDSGVDDVAYLTSLVEELSALPGVASEHIYFMGHENGGFMSYRMACELSAAIAGIVVVRGTDFATDEACVPDHPVSVLHIAGTEDTFPGYTYDPEVHPVPYASAPEAVQRWADRAGCDVDAEEEGEPLDLDTRVVGAETRVSRFEEGCTAGVELWTIEGAGDGPAIHQTEPVPGFTRLTTQWMRRQSR